MNLNYHFKEIYSVYSTLIDLSIIDSDANIITDDIIQNERNGICNWKKNKHD